MYLESVSEFLLGMQKRFEIHEGNLCRVPNMACSAAKFSLSGSVIPPKAMADSEIVLEAFKRFDTDGSGRQKDDSEGCLGRFTERLMVDLVFFCVFFYVFLWCLWFAFCFFCDIVTTLGLFGNMNMFLCFMWAS